MQHKETASQTAGPYVHIGCTPNVTGITRVYTQDLGDVMIKGPIRGREIVVSGTVFDGDGNALSDAMVEIWQADAAGLYQGAEGADPNFTGWGRCAGDMATGAFTFQTVKPGPVPMPDGRIQAPHITIWIVARGINLGLHTRMYFADEPQANAADPLLRHIAPPERAQTLLASCLEPGRYHFDIHLQGTDETVFLDI
ncbi:MAG: protocatechuate 3,4-dioxygenase subunit alpha [Sulfitobacter sp.]